MTAPLLKQWIDLLELKSGGRVGVVDGRLVLFIDGQPAAQTHVSACPVDDVLRLGVGWSLHVTAANLAMRTGEA